MAIFDLKITLYKAAYASITDFKHDAQGFCRAFYRHESQCAVRQNETFAHVYMSSNERSLNFDHSTHIGRIQIERGNFSEECGIDIASLSRVFDEDGAVDLMVSKLKRNTRYVCGHVHGV